MAGVRDVGAGSAVTKTRPSDGLELRAPVPERPDAVMSAAVRTTFLAVLTVVLLVGAVGARDGSRYLNAWAVRVRGGPREADQLARELGYQNMGPVSIFSSTSNAAATEIPFQHDTPDDRLPRVSQWSKSSFFFPASCHGTSVYAHSYCFGAIGSGRNHRAGNGLETPPISPQKCSDPIL